MFKDVDVLVIGAGIIGSSAAYFLSKSGKRVVLVEKEIPATGSSGACDGT